jgi:adenosine kinase
MTILVSGSLAFDLIFNYPGRFARDILPDQLHILNVSFFVPSMRRDYGGCAGNIAYNLSQLGSKVVVAGALGADGKDYLARLQQLGVDTQCTLLEESANTALALIVTDADNNQISAFHPGAMEQAHRIELPKGLKLTLGLVGPDSGQAMLARARQLHDAKVPFVFDPGQAMPLFDGEALRGFIDQATWLALNDYEAKVLSERTGLSIQQIAMQDNIQGVIVTLGAEGCEVWVKGSKTRIDGLKVTEALDPTGCGDAFRAGMLHGLSIGWSLPDAALLGNRMGALKVAHLGGQSHAVNRAGLGLN